MTPSNPEELLAIAHIVRPHGIRGEVSAMALAPSALDFASLAVGRVFARFPTGEVREMEVLDLRPHQDRWLIVLEGIETMNDAETVRQVDLCLPRAELPPLPEGWFWETDLQHCHVVDRAVGPLGTVKGLNTAGAQPQLEIHRPDGSIVSIPWVKAFIAKVDLAVGEITTDLPLDFPGISAPK